MERCHADQTELPPPICVPPSRQPANEDWFQRRRRQSVERSLEEAPARRCPCGKPMRALGCRGSFNALGSLGRDFAYGCVVCDHGVGISSVWGLITTALGVGMMAVVVVFWWSDADKRSWAMLIPASLGLRAGYEFIVGLRNRLRHPTITPIRSPGW